jgi:hypothetical protein
MTTSSSTSWGWNLLGICSLILVVGSIACWYLPYSPTMFALGIVGLPLLSLLLAFVAGLFGHRWWLVAAILPVLLLVFMVPQYEQTTKIKLSASDSGIVTFNLSGTWVIPDFTVYRYSPNIEKPADPRFEVWRFDMTGNDPWKGKVASLLGKVRYGIVPAGYVQQFPDQGAPQSLEPGTIYHVVGGGTGEYFRIKDGKPEPLPTPSDAPCFALKDNQWLKVPCIP